MEISSINNLANIAAIPKKAAHTDKSPTETSDSALQASTASSLVANPIKSVADNAALKSESSTQNREKVGEAVNNINNFFQMTKRSMQFSINEDTGRTIIEIKDEKTGDIIRQIPSEEVLQLEKKLGEVEGLLFSKKA
ncbi:MAG: flagellar protein FlaG [Methylovulum sp.]|nr:flagellar protein FlaG [Methylovulum sp.]MCF7997895.1 flagellar protein FlaG [Methylovulum sp.]